MESYELFLLLIVFTYTLSMLLIVPLVKIYDAIKYPLDNIITRLENPGVTPAIRHMITHSQRHLVQLDGECLTCRRNGANTPRINREVQSLEGKAWIQVYDSGYQDGFENRKKPDSVLVKVRQDRI